MQSVRVRRSGISADQAAEVLRSALGSGYQVSTANDDTLIVGKGLARAQVSLRHEPGGTVFEVSGKGVSWLPLLNVITKSMSERGIVTQAAAAIGDAEAFGGNG